MKRELIDEVIACLPEGRTLFHYFKGEYAFNLLSYASQTRQSVADIKKSSYQRLLNQPEVKSVLAREGHGKLSPDLFKHIWNESSEDYVLTLDSWGDNHDWGNQLTRSGGNLVLQMNFSEKHNRAYQKLVKPEDEFVFNYDGHPVMAKGKRSLFRNTLAWSRLDIDLDSGEVLIEEIQSDWVRKVKACTRIIHRGRKPGLLKYCECSSESFMTYADNVFSPFVNVWPEAMLMATIKFIYTELGISNIYYHTFDTGAKMKNISGKPPRSLYSDLPRKFCFELTAEDPYFLKNDKSFKRKRRKVKDVNWYKMEI